MARVLVPLAVLEGESIPVGLVELLGPVEVTILGYHELPEQTPPDQARVQYGDRAVDALADLATEFRDAGSEVEYRLVFTHDREQTIDRVADETGARAYVITDDGTDRTAFRTVDWRRRHRSHPLVRRRTDRRSRHRRQPVSRDRSPRPR